MTHIGEALTTLYDNLSYVRIIPREVVVFFVKMSKELRAYIAGFLDGDGSIHVRLKPNKTYRFRFQIAPSIVFYQAKKEKHYLEWMQKTLQRGYLRERNDGIIEYIIGDRESMLWLIKELLPYLKLKQKQAQLMKEILVLQKKVEDGKDFLHLSQRIDEFQELNYSKKRTQNSLLVEEALKREGLLTP